jgi:hypothetical protein
MTEEKTHLYPEIVSLVLAMWDDEAEAIADEASARFNISYDYAFELVNDAIVEEVEIEREMLDDDGEEYLFDYEEDALASAGFGTDESY